MESLLTAREQNYINIDETATTTDEEDECFSSFFPTLTWQERMGGCLACMILGYILSLGSFFRMKDLMAGNPSSFVIYTTLGNIISLSGSFFLSGPRAQVHKMFHPTRRVATGVYLGSLLPTLAVAFGRTYRGQAVLLLVLMALQYVAIAWYCISYIPFARQMIRSYFGRVASQFEELD